MINDTAGGVSVRESFHKLELFCDTATLLRHLFLGCIQLVVRGAIFEGDLWV